MYFKAFITLTTPTSEELNSLIASTEAQSPIPRTTRSTTLSTLLSSVKRKETADNEFLQKSYKFR